MHIFKTRLFQICLLIWLILWVIFFFRENKDGEYKDFFVLAGKNLEGKRAYLMGEGFYGFVNFCSQNTSPEARYKFAGLGPMKIEEIRAIYHLWPRKAVEENYEYIFVYDAKGFSEEGFFMFKDFNGSSYVLKRK